jgi:hypothetical protein
VATAAYIAALIGSSSVPSRRMEQSCFPPSCAAPGGAGQRPDWGQAGREQRLLHPIFAIDEPMHRHAPRMPQASGFYSSCAHGGIRRDLNLALFSHSLAPFQSLPNAVCIVSVGWRTYAEGK